MTRKPGCWVKKTPTHPHPIWRGKRICIAFLIYRLRLGDFEMVTWWWRSREDILKERDDRGICWNIYCQPELYNNNNNNNIRGAFNKFPDFFCTGIYYCRSLFKIQYVIAIHLIRWPNNFYDFRFKWTATAAIGIHPTEALSSQLVDFKNTIWMWGRMICNKIVF